MQASRWGRLGVFLRFMQKQDRFALEPRDEFYPKMSICNYCHIPALVLRETMSQ